MITSVQNAKIKLVRELLGAKKHREKARSIVIEGVRLAEESLAANLPVHFCLYSERISDRGRGVVDQIQALSFEAEEISEGLLDRISDTKTSQGILLVTPIPEIGLKTKIDSVVVLDKIRDPGNMGTILRTAAAMDLGAVLLTPGTADPFSPKVMRAAMGAHFRIPIRTMTVEDIHSFCKQRNGLELSILLTDTACSQASWETDLAKPVCILVGSEADGVSPEMREIVDECISIPMSSKMESFNAAVSASILMYEMTRQRKTK
ncbi:MAG: RNA methyltransferase [Pelolinea sp.]|nr:RNA methyltransferase [Pelolinea sp.]